MPYNASVASTYARIHARLTSIGRCAEYVRRAIDNGGQPIAHTARAKDMGHALTDAGFGEVPNATPQAGDVVVIQPAPGHPDGHAAIYDGQRWVSDFRQQHGLYPGPAYRQARPSYKIYRHN